MPGSVLVGTARVNFIVNSQQFAAGIRQSVSAFQPYVNTLGTVAGRQSLANTTLDHFNQSLRASLIATAGYAVGVNLARKALDEVVGNTIRYDAGLIAVSKTTGLTAEETERLGSDIEDLGIDMSALGGPLPILAEDLLDIAVIAGQMRVQGVPALRDFSETVGLLTLTTNLGAEGAANSLGKILALTAALPTEVLNLGSVITRLGNEFRGGETEILAQAQSIAAATSQYELNAQTLLGVSAVLSQAGVQAESSGTVIQRVFQLLANLSETQRVLISNAARVADTELEEALDLGDREQQLRLFIQALSRLEDRAEEGGSEISRATFLESLFGESNVRITRVLGVLARDFPEFTRALELANEEWEETNALTDEAARRAEAYEARLTVVTNAIDAQGRAIGDTLVPALVAAAEQYQLIETLAVAAGTALGVGFLRRRGARRREDDRAATAALIAANAAGRPVDDATRRAAERDQRRRQRATILAPVVGGDRPREPGAARDTTARGRQRATAALARSVGASVGVGLSRALAFVGGPLGLAISLIAGIGTAALVSSRGVKTLEEELAEMGETLHDGLGPLERYRDAIEELAQIEARPASVFERGLFREDRPSPGQRRAGEERERREEVLRLAEDEEALAEAQARIERLTAEIEEIQAAGPARSVRRAARPRRQALEDELTGLRIIRAQALIGNDEEDFDLAASSGRRILEITRELEEIDEARRRGSRENLQNLQQERDALSAIVGEATELAAAESEHAAVLEAVDSLSRRANVELRSLIAVLDEARSEARLFFGELDADAAAELRLSEFLTQQAGAGRSRLAELRFQGAEAVRAETEGLQRTLDVRIAELDRLNAHAEEVSALLDEAREIDSDIGTAATEELTTRADEVAEEVTNLEEEIAHLQRQLDALRGDALDDEALQRLAEQRGRQRLAEIDEGERLGTLGVETAREAPAGEAPDRIVRQPVDRAADIAREAGVRQRERERALLDDILAAQTAVQRQEIEGATLSLAVRTRSLVSLEAVTQLERDRTALIREEADALREVRLLEGEIGSIRGTDDGGGLTDDQLDEIERLTGLLLEARGDAAAARQGLDDLGNVDLSSAVDQLAQLETVLSRATPILDELTNKLIFFDRDGALNFENLGVALERLAVSGFDAFGDTLGDILLTASSNVESFAGRVSEAFSDLAGQIARDLLRILIRAVIVENILAAIQGFRTGSQPTQGLVDFANSGLPVAHEGGIAGSLTNVQRGPLRPNEHIVVLEEGEEVLTRRDPRHRLNLPRYHEGGVVGGGPRGGGPGLMEVSIVNNGQPARIADVQTSQRPDRLVTQIILEDINRRGPISRAVQAR